MISENHSPIISEWGLYFDKKHGGEENRTAILKDLLEFLSNPRLKNIIVLGVVVIGGEIYGSKRYEPGEPIITSRIKTIVRVKDDILEVETASGSIYYLRKGGYNAHMAKMLCDVLLYGKVQKRNSLWIKIEN